MHKPINAVLNKWVGVAIYIWPEHGGRYTHLAGVTGVVIYSRLASVVVLILAIVNFLYNNYPENNSRCSYIIDRSSPPSCYYKSQKWTTFRLFTVFWNDRIRLIILRFSSLVIVRCEWAESSSVDTSGWLIPDISDGEECRVSKNAGFDDMVASADSMALALSHIFAQSFFWTRRRDRWQLRQKRHAAVLPTTFHCCSAPHPGTRSWNKREKTCLCVSSSCERRYGGFSGGDRRCNRLGDEP